MSDDESIQLMKTCVCKGIRTCIVCEASGKPSVLCTKDSASVYLYCDDCKKVWLEDVNSHPDHKGLSLDFPGVFIQHKFISTEEETAISGEIYKVPFVDSQSGRRKQDFGPKVNFKKRKVKSVCFTGLPAFSKHLYTRMQTVDILSDFVPVEQCHLEYTPERGSAIDPHFDDFWLWGERLVTLNILSDTILYFTHDDIPDIEVHVPIKQRSLIVVYGEARTKWKHAIHREHIKSKRVAITLRELSHEFSADGPRGSEGRQLLDIALTFNGSAVG